MTRVQDRLTQLGIVLPDVFRPAGTYLPANTYGNLVYVSGQGTTAIQGQVGGDLSIEQGYAAARQAGLLCLAALQAEIGSLDRVVKVFKVLGFVNCAPGFRQQPAVINGCSDLLVEVFGEAGRHARSAIGAAALPENIAVEVEMLVAVE